jgi:hypothetical protein
MSHLWKGTPVYNPYHPRDLTKGSYIYSKGNMSMKQKHHDSIVGILKPGEIVIPVKYKGRHLAKEIIQMLQDNNIWLPHMRK